MDVTLVVAPAVLPEIRELLTPPASGSCRAGVLVPASQGKASKFVYLRVDDNLGPPPVLSGEPEQPEGVCHPKLCGAERVDSPAREVDGDFDPDALPRRRKIEAAWSGETVNHTRLHSAEPRTLEQEAQLRGAAGCDTCT